MFQRARLPGFWTFGSAVQPAELEHIDDYAYAIDGSGGGTYAPSAVITIGGSGLTVSGPFNATDAEQIDVGTSLSVLLGATFQLYGDQIVNSGAIVGFTSGSFLTVQSGATATFNSGAIVTYNCNVQLGGTAKIVFTSPRSYRRPCRIVWVDAGYWGPDATLPDAWPHRAQQTIATNPSNPATNLRYECDIPPGASAVKAEVWIHPASGHAGVPANRPQLIVWIYDSDGETCAVTGSPAVASNASVAAYELRQLLTVTAGVNTLAVPQKVICQVYGEAGANFVAGLVIDEPTFTFSTSQMNEP